jgi:hypothetical protein
MHDGYQRWRFERPTRIARLCLGLVLMLVAALPPLGSQEPRPSREPRQDTRKTYAAFLALPAEQQKRVRAIVKELGQEDPESQARLLQVLHRYVTWLERLSPTDRQYLDASAHSLERLGRIRELREKQWLETLPRADRERMDRVNRRREQDQARQATLWAAGRLVQLGSAPGVAITPPPLLEERQRVIAGFRWREHRMELERQLALTQGPERQEAMNRELNRLRNAFKEKPLTREERQFVNQYPPEDMIAYVRGLVELARKYDVPLPEPRRQPLLAPTLPALNREKLLDFLKEHFSEVVQKEYEERLKEPKKRAAAVAELTALYWNTHPQELREARKQERERKGKDQKPSPPR